MDTSIKEQQFTTIITPRTGWFDINLKEVWAYRDLILLFVKRSFVSQYKQTILGPAWAFIQPFLTTIVFTLIFGNIAGLAPGGIPSFAFYFSGNIVWQYFSGCLSSTANTFVANARTMGKVYYPRLVMPISTVLSQLISFGIQFVFLVFFVLYFTFTKQGVHPNWWILMTPVLLLQLAMLSMGFGIIISSVTTKYRDLAKLVGFGVHLWMYGTPIVYPLSMVPEGTLRTLILANPMTSIIEAFKYATLGQGYFSWAALAYSFTFMCVLLLFGIVIFNKVQRSFMDTV